MLQTFTTKATSRAERSRQWCAITHARHIEFADDCQASIRGGDFGRLRLCQVSMGRHLVVQSGADVAGTPPPALKFLFQEQGRATIRQARQENEVQAGQWCALRKDIPFEIDAPAHSRQLCITVPCEVMPGPVGSTSWWRRSRGFLRGPAQILHASAAASVITGGILSRRDREQLGSQLAQLVEMMIRTEDCDAMPDARELRRRAILEFIDNNLANPELGVGLLTRTFDWSSRTIHKLFEGEAHTVVRAIWDRRLERCRDELIDPTMAGRSITDIAHSWAFSDSQHFSRAFRARYGASPREYRALHLPR